MYKKVKHKLRKKALERKFRREENYLSLADFDSTKKGVLIVDSMVPEYDRDSGSRRLFHIIEIVLKRDFNVFLMADTNEYRFKDEYCQKYKEMGAVVYVPGLDGNNKLIDREKSIQLIAPHIDFAWLHRPDIFYKYYELVKKQSNAKLIFDMVDFHYLRLKRKWELSKASELEQEMKKYLKMELHNAEMADVVVPITAEDKRELLPLLKKKVDMAIVGNIHQFKHENLGFQNFDQRENLLFIGSFIHAPNLEAVRFLHDKILPILLKELPALKIDIIGSYAPQEILDLNSENFRVLGFVEDISEFFNKAKLFVAPLAFGAGIKGKIGQSLEFGLPLITTEIGAEGFDFSPYEDHMIASMDDPIDFAEKIIALYNDEKLWRQVSNNSEKILKPFSLAQIEENVTKILT
ncbi:glycosyltransferase [Aequorivita marina]|uniref:glycosyltransferase n=1 Tax=Aequorivita marina TaxID=3073654 RepID=UPI0028741145|nr:glycosyltransferase [Aequorivita sp. S2608]MDS1298094.1 glycosyltransferase [Aequorivita sp. S2608]